MACATCEWQPGQAQPVPGIPLSQGQPTATVTQGPSASGTGDVSYQVISGVFFNARRSCPVFDPVSNLTRHVVVAYLADKNAILAESTAISSPQDMPKP